MMPPANGHPASADCVLIASGTAFAAEQSAHRAGLDPRIIISKRDCARRLGSVHRQARALGINTIAIHSMDWNRQSLPQLFELAALRLGLPDCRILIGDGGVQLPLSRARLALRTAQLPLDGVAGALLVGAEVAHVARARRRPAAVPEFDGERNAVLAIWPETRGAIVGGPVTHMSGILAGFRQLGFRVGVLALGPLPPELGEVADDVEVAPPLPRAARLTGEMAAVCSNRVAREAGRRLARRLRPSLVYQRHAEFVTFGVELADAADVPLVLEWNKSEAWGRVHWHARNPLKRAFDPLAVTMERYVLQRARLVASVSSHSAEMAVAEGAPRKAVVVLPNGVDIEVINRARLTASVGTRSGPVLGWVGTFCPWHGADVLVRALTRLPKEVRAALKLDPSSRPCRARG